MKADTEKKPEPPAAASVIAPPGCDLYLAHRGDSIPSVARKYLRRTKYLTSAELAEAIRKANHDRQGVSSNPESRSSSPECSNPPL